MLKKLAAISLTAGALVLAAPAVATAAPSGLAHVSASDPYANDPRAWVDDPIIDVCDVSTVTFGAGYFLPGERLGVSVSGLDAANATYSGSTAAADGGLVLTFRPPSGGSGSYAITFTGAERSYTATITVSSSHDDASSCDHDPGVAAAGTELPLSGSSSNMELALTGASVSPWVLGGGAIAAAGGGILIATAAVRRRRA
ncbi:hypothetical protein ACWGJP_14205 [Microbacterium sp. NPDC055903]